MTLIRIPIKAYDFKLKEINGQQFIYDIVRKKFLLITPEEWVRQNILQYLMDDLLYPKALISLEKELIYNNLKRRTDILVYDRNNRAKLIVECKAATVKINQKTFDQIARYNLQLKVPWLLVTNGATSYCAYIDFKKNQFDFRENIPRFDDL
jgi:Type I restriction enzyme R protein N terminus (HSDR_N)